eukprot:1139168-Pelagomonas_calceolata.AAC.2
MPMGRQSPRIYLWDCPPRTVALGQRQDHACSAGRNPQRPQDAKWWALCTVCDYTEVQGRAPKQQLRGKKQVLNGRLYGANSNDRDWAIRAAEDLLTLVIYLYDIPDMDFILHLHVLIHATVWKIKEYKKITDVVEPILIFVKERTPGVRRFSNGAMFPGQIHQFPAVTYYAVVMVQSKDIQCLQSTSTGTTRMQAKAGYMCVPSGDGFTFPYVDNYMWQGLSLQQAVVLADCNRIR